MGARHFHPFARKARPILSTRDYDAARKHLKGVLKEPAWLREDSRIEALIRELTDFEDRFVMRERWVAIEWAECVFVPSLDEEGSLRRRWSDAGTAA